MRIRIPPYLFVAVFFAFPGVLHAEGGVTRSFALPGHGALQLVVPDSWQSKVSQPPKDLPPTLSFAPSGKPAFEVLITPIWPAGPDVALPPPVEIKKRVEQAASQVKPQAVEKSIPVREFKGPSVTGYYFFATDKAPKPGEYKYMTQGIARLDTLLITFTALTNDGQEHIPVQTIDMLQGAVHTGGGPAQASSGGPARQDAIQVNRVGDLYRFSVPVSRLVLSIPAAGFTQRNMAVGGSTDNPRYFFLESPAEHINISGWFEPDSAYKGVKKHWEIDASAWKKRNLPEPRDVTFAKVGSWEAVYYDNELPVATNAHLRAHWVQAGTWIDIHLSIITKKPSKEARAQLETLLKSITVAEK